MQRGRLTSRHLLELETLPREDIELILKTAEAFWDVLHQPIPKLPTLRGRTILNLFFEPSTRTKASFDLAAKRLSADLVSISRATSSVTKGESLLDTLKNLESMRIDLVVVRHRAPGIPHLLARYTHAAVINAGDGAHEHPTQALLDLFTLQRVWKTLEGKTVAIVGDILHSRVARSNVYGLTRMGARVWLVGPPPLVPKDLALVEGVEVAYNVEEVLQEVDAWMALRVQKERLEGSFFGGDREYFLTYGLTRERASRMKPDSLILHPGPVNWGVELEEGIESVRKTLILSQVTHGVAVRMALLYLLIPPAEEVAA
jgi:aspartate carbamoyltransferase catalytic subunit